MTRTGTTNGTLGAASDSSISTTITSTVTLGSAGYLGPLSITSTGAIIAPAGVGATGLVAPAGIIGASIDNQGHIVGGTGSPGRVNRSDGQPEGGGGAGGSGVDLDGGTLTNEGTITGGNGGNGTFGLGSHGGAGGSGAYLDGGTLITSGTITGGVGGVQIGAAGAAVQFGTAAADLIVDPGAVFNGQVVGFAVGDTIEFAGVTATGSNYAGGILTLHETVGSVTLDLPGTFTTASNFHVAPIPGGTAVTVACFAARTRILTTAGAVPVEDLRVGDHVATLRGRRLARIVWLGHRQVDCQRHPRPDQVWPVPMKSACLCLGDAAISRMTG